MSEQLFIQASREQLRFQSEKGLLTTEDLWSLSLVSLDKMAVNINSTLSDSGTSFLKNTNSRETKETKAQKLRLEILKTVITIKQEENEAKKTKAEKESKKAFFKELIHEKELEELKGMSKEDIQKMLAAVE